MVGIGVVYGHANLEFLTHLSGPAGLGEEGENNGRVARLAVFVRAQRFGVINPFLHAILGLMGVEGLDAPAHIDPRMQGGHLPVFRTLFQLSLLL